MGMLMIVNAAFKDAKSFEDGATTLCLKLAKFFDSSNQWDGCPVTHVLFDGPGNERFREHTNALFDRCIGAISSHAIRLGKNPQEALRLADALLIGIQGSWIMARARRSSDVIRQIPRRIFPDSDARP